MAGKKHLDELSTRELEQALRLRRQAETEARLVRLREEGRVIETEADRARALDPALVGAGQTPRPRRTWWQRLADGALLLIEIAAVVGLVAILANLWVTNRQLNDELAEAQRDAAAALVVPTATPPPLIDVAVLPGGHLPPVDGRPPQPGEAGPIPAHLLPVINAYVPPPVPTPGPQQARRLQIPAINVDSPIAQGDDWEQLKKGVGQYVGSMPPGQGGNVVLSAHNDIYGETFRYLDRLKSGDEVVVSTEGRDYTYVVDEIQIVAPTDTWVMGPTERDRVTLISCYPYRVNTSRIVVFASPKDE